ncbi:PEP-CTERM sorting domain-containing protein [Rhodopirellula baltica]
MTAKIISDSEQANTNSTSLNVSVAASPLDCLTQHPLTKTGKHTTMKFFLAAVPLLALLFGNSTSAAVLGAGNLIVTDSASNSVREFTLGGSLVQSFTVIPPGENELPKGLKVDADGNVQIFNGTFSPELATIDAATGVQTNRSGGFTTNNALGYGKVAVAGSSVLVPDQPTANGPGQGILRFNGQTVERVVSDFAPTSISIGQDGLLTVLGSSAGAAASNPREVRIYNPMTFELVSEFEMPRANAGISFRGLVADNMGNFYAHEYGDEIFRLDSSGNILARFVVTSSPAESLIDIDIDPSGTIALGTMKGSVILTDTSFSSPTTFVASAATGSIRPIYVGFTSPVVAVPEPATAGLLLVASGLAMHRQRRRKRSCVENN